MEFFEKFQLVIASGLPEALLFQLESILAGLKTPLIICNAYGFLGYLRLVLPEHAGMSLRILMLILVESYGDSS